MTAFSNLTQWFTTISCEMITLRDSLNNKGRKKHKEYQLLSMKEVGGKLSYLS